MNISALSAKMYNKNISTRNNANITSFKSKQKGISDAQMDASLGMLKKKITCVMTNSNMQDLKIYMDAIADKWKTKSVGLVLIPAEKLKSFLDGVVKIHDKDLKDRTGICVAAGDKYGPVETWSKAYETIVALMPEEEFKSSQGQKSQLK
jgi:hypothetical protein